MTIDQAIINIITLHKCLEANTDPIFLASLQLGIEALERIRKLRKGTFTMLLPSETEE